MTPYFRATKGVWSSGVGRETAALFSLNKVAMQTFNRLKPTTIYMYRLM
jgi:hypothetical protein